MWPANLDHIAFGDPAGGAVGCADADNEPAAQGRDPAAPGVTADRDDHFRSAAGPEGVDNRRNLDPVALPADSTVAENITFAPR